MKKFMAMIMAGAALSTFAADKPMNFGKELFNMPEITPAAVRHTTPAGVKNIFMTGPEYNGKPTKVFACYGVPAGKDGKKVPGVVLLHGSGGTAFANWVALWNARGYAAIAVDYNGRIPRGVGWNGNTANAVNPDGGPTEQLRYKMEIPHTESFTYHAVAATLMAHSVLAAQDGVDSDRIGIIGISMGGVLALRVAGIDHRLNFATAIYGCGNMMRGTVFGDRSRKNYKMSEAGVREYIESHDPLVYLPAARCPVFMVNNTNDPFFRTKPWLETLAAVKSGAYQSMRMNFKHGHVNSDVPEIKLFADWVNGKNVELPQLSAPVRIGDKLGAAVSGIKAASWTAELIWTADKGYGVNRKWQSSPAQFNASGDQLEAEFPAGCKHAFFRVSNKNGAGFTTPHILF